ncbi:hypothetical protein [Burkholderia sp. Ac-20379]|uniref:hypothetical protein n=1 Tax=Burkholderia sp. Ac-20379 TaxID=2703900 RepID=UPI00197D6D8C|nr:hypothetical protein [Burkholderia sp. Ac-20379]MBN3723048.1 hypothetical protein [Burkholderia sp. Ac-20379]
MIRLFSFFALSLVTSITTGNLASATSATAGWISSTTGALAAAPSLYSPAFVGIASVATAAGIGADAVSQVLNPNIGGYLVSNSANIVGNGVWAGKFPGGAPAFNAMVSEFNNAPAAIFLQGFVNTSWKYVAEGAKK